jgi:hypothetical protein
MKLRNLFITTIVAGATLGVSCKKNSSSSTTTPYKCTTCTTAPMAVAANDNNAKGIYKGVIIGSTGTVIFDIQNTTNTVSAKLVIDATVVNLTSSNVWTSGQAFVGTFTGGLNGQNVFLSLAINADGSNPMVQYASIPGHPGASFDIVKETSVGLVEGFEGTYNTTRPETGSLNIVLSRTLGKWGGIARKTGDTTVGEAGHGAIINNQLIDSANNNRVIGTLNNDQLDGKFVDNNGTTVTITAKRTL